MSRYPTTAELAAFRRDIERSTRGGLRVAIFDDVMSRPPGAIDYERSHGIGARGVRSGHWYTAGDDHAEARSEASAMRSRAFGMLPDTAATEAAIERYAPTR